MIFYKATSKVQSKKPMHFRQKRDMLAAARGLADPELGVLIIPDHWTKKDLALRLLNGDTSGMDEYDLGTWELLQKRRPLPVETEHG